MLKYSPALEKIIDAKHELLAGSEEEVEIRAATVQAVEQMREAWFQKEGGKEGGREGVCAGGGEFELKEELPPHHRTVTFFY